MSLVSVSVARKRLNCSAQSVRRFISEGVLLGHKTDSGRWMVSEDSLSALAASRNLQHHKPKQAIPNATPVVPNVASNVVRRPPSSNDIAKYRAHLREILTDRGLTWLEANELVALFHNTILDYGRADQFKLSLIVDWSALFRSLYLVASDYGSLSRFDGHLVKQLVDPDSIYELSGHDIDFVNDVFGVIGDSREWECEISRYVEIYYNETLVCRSAPEARRTLLVA